MIDTLNLEEETPKLAVVTENPETILMNRSNIERVQRTIEDLPAHYRETLLLCEVEEMSYGEIAEILSIPIGTVMSRLARARKVVRQSLRSESTDRQSIESVSMRCLNASVADNPGVTRQ